MSKGEGVLFLRWQVEQKLLTCKGGQTFSFSLFLHHGRSLTICYGMIRVWLLFNNIEEVKKTYLWLKSVVGLTAGMLHGDFDLGCCVKTSSQDRWFVLVYISLSPVRKSKELEFYGWLLFSGWLHAVLGHNFGNWIGRLVSRLFTFFLGFYNLKEQLASEEMLHNNALLRLRLSNWTNWYTQHHEDGSGVLRMEWLGS